METTVRVIPTTTFMNLGVIDGVHTFGTDLSALFGPGADALWDGNAPFLLESARTGRRIPMVPCDHKRNDEGEVLSRDWLGALPDGGTVCVVVFND